MSEWEIKQLSSIVDIISGGTPKTDVPEYWNGDIYWLAVNDFSGDRRWVHKSEKTITENGLQNSATKLLKVGDLIISARGTVGELAQIGRPMAFNQSCYGIRGKSGYDNGFIYYALKQQLAQLKSVANGAVFDTIILKTFDHIKVFIPDLPTQTLIAGILSPYDDAIENNNRRITLLENAARELYREWFVRFRFPGHEKVRFVNGLPEGWEVRRLRELSDFRYGIMPDKNRISDNGYPIYSGYRITGYYDEYMFSNEQLVLIARGVGGTGEVCISPRFCYLTNLSIAFILKDEIHKFYLYERFQEQNLRELDTGAAQSQITINSLEQYKVILPPKLLLKRFDILAKAIYEEKQLLQSQSQNLAHQRDLLLPRLMSGKLEV